jgi:hypothetical protein
MMLFIPDSRVCDRCDGTGPQHGPGRKGTIGSDADRSRVRGLSEIAHR